VLTSIALLLDVQRTMFFGSVFPVILALQPLVLHIVCMSMTTFCISGQQRRFFKAAFFKLASVMFWCSAGRVTVSREVLSFLP